MGNKKYGLNYERKEKKYLLEHEEIYAHRCRGSFGMYDIISFNEMRFMLTSVKSTKQKYFSFKTEIQRIKQDREYPKSTKRRLVLYHKGKRKVLFEDEI